MRRKMMLGWYISVGHADAISLLFIIMAVEFQRAEKDEEGNDEIVPPFQDLFILLGYAGLLDTLQLEEGPFTVFAPTDDAFHKFLFSYEAVSCHHDKFMLMAFSLC